jgi:hypothetical protein
VECGNLEKGVPPWKCVIWKRGAAVEVGNLEEGVPPWRWVIWRKKGCHRGVR